MAALCSRQISSPMRQCTDMLEGVLPHTDGLLEHEGRACQGR